MSSANVRLPLFSAKYVSWSYNASYYVPINTIIDAIITTTKISWWYHSLPIIFPDLPHASKCVFINTLNDAIITKKNFMVIIIQCQVCLLIFQCIIICPHRHNYWCNHQKKIHEDNQSVPNMCPDLPMHHNVSQSTQLLMQSSQKKNFMMIIIQCQLCPMHHNLFPINTIIDAIMIHDYNFFTLICISW